MDNLYLIPMQRFHFRYNNSPNLDFKVDSYTIDGSDIDLKKYNEYATLYDIYDYIRKRYKNE